MLNFDSILLATGEMITLTKLRLGYYADRGTQRKFGLPEMLTSQDVEELDIVARVILLEPMYPFNLKDARKADKSLSGGGYIPVKKK